MHANSVLIEKTLSCQQPGGCWYEPENFYVYTKYKGTVWSLILLAELGADGTDERIHRASEFIFTWSQHRARGGFAFHGSAETGGEDDCIMPCLTGNMVYCLIRFGYLHDARLQKAIEWITTYSRADDGEGKAPRGFPYQSDHCWGRHTCMIGVVKLLRALVEIPEAERTQKVQSSITQAVDFILLHQLYRRSHNPVEIANPAWLKLGWPHMANTDILEMLSLLQKLRVKDERIRPALSELIAMRGIDGFWLNQNAKEGRMQVHVEREGAPSAHITQTAVDVLDYFKDLIEERG